MNNGPTVGRALSGEILFTTSGSEILASAENNRCLYINISMIAHRLVM